MATSETLRPSRATEIAPTLVDGANAYDGNATTFARVNEAAEGGTAAATWDQFPSGSIPATKRRSVILRAWLKWGTADANDKAAVYARAKNGDPWTLLAYGKPPNTFLDAYLDLDVTDLIGSGDIADMDVQVVFSNLGTGSSGDPPIVIDHGA